MKYLRKIKLLPNAIRGYDRSDPYRNGEYKFIRSYLKNNMTIFDVGANTGEYAKYILSINPDVRIFCFEPVLNTYRQLINNLSDEINNGKLVVNNFGLSDNKNEAEIFIYEDLSGNNSLYFNEIYGISKQFIRKEKIFLTTINDYTINNNIRNINYLKIDVEGHELRVIKGASDLINKKKINCIQFEYNSNWKVSGSKLGEVFEYLTAFGYEFYRLTIWGKIPINKCKPALENYKHSNYIALLNER